MAATSGVMYTDEGELEFESTSVIFVWRALRNCATADFEENVEEMVGMTGEEDFSRSGKDSEETERLTMERIVGAIVDETFLRSEVGIRSKSQ